MKQFNNLKMTLFDSTNASFKLTVEGVFTSRSQDGQNIPLAYVTDQGNGQMTSNIYLTFSSKAEGAKPLYTSYPQLYKFRKIFKDINNLIEGNGYMQDNNGVLIVNPNNVDPFIMANIGKKNRWISFKTIVLEATNEGNVTERIPGVEIAISNGDSNTTSFLSAEEFQTIYTIIDTLDLVSIQATMTALYMSNQTGQNMYSPQIAQPMYTNNPQYPQYGMGAAIPQSGFNRGFNNRNFNNPQQSFQQNGQTGSTRRTVPSYNNQPSYAPAQTQNQTRYVSEQNNASNNIPPRSSAPIVNMSAVEDTPVSEIDFNDAAAIEAIFGTEDN